MRRHAAQNDADARHQFARRERLRHIVIGADLQAHHAVDLIAAGGQENHRRIAKLAQAAAHLQPAHIRQADIEHHQFRHRSAALPAHDGQRLFAQRHMQRREAVGAQRVGDAIRNRLLILHDQDSSRHSKSTSSTPADSTAARPQSPPWTECGKQGQQLCRFGEIIFL
jgi:hypothetical protein